MHNHGLAMSQQSKYVVKHTYLRNSRDSQTFWIIEDFRGQVEEHLVQSSFSAGIGENFVNEYVPKTESIRFPSNRCNAYKRIIRVHQRTF